MQVKQDMSIINKSTLEKLNINAELKKWFLGHIGELRTSELKGIEVDYKGYISTLKRAYGVGLCVHRTFDEYGNMLTETINDKTDVYKYNHYGKPTHIQRAYGSWEKFIYDYRGRLIYAEDNNGAIARTEYDGNDRKLEVMENDDVITFEYDKLGLLRTKLSKLERIDYMYDTDKNLIDKLVKTPSGYTREIWLYDKNNRVEEYINYNSDGNKYSSQQVWDDTGRLLSYKDSTGYTYKINYKENGLVVKRDNTNNIWESRIVNGVQLTEYESINGSTYTHEVTKDRYTIEICYMGKETILSFPRNEQLTEACCV